MYCTKFNYVMAFIYLMWFFIQTTRFTYRGHLCLPSVVSNESICVLFLLSAKPDSQKLSHAHLPEGPPQLDPSGFFAIVNLKVNNS